MKKILLQFTSSLELWTITVCCG